MNTEIKAKAVTFLESMGFSDVRPVHGPEVRMLVRDALKVVRKRLKARGMKFALVEDATTPSARIQKFYVLQNRQVLGHLHLTAYTTHSVIELINI